MGIDRNSEPHHPIGQSTSFSPPSPPINTQTTTLPQKKEQIAKLCTLDSPFIKQEQKKTAPKNPGAPGAPQGHFECERQYERFLKKKIEKMMKSQKEKGRTKERRRWKKEKKQKQQ